MRLQLPTRSGSVLPASGRPPTRDAVVEGVHPGPANRLLGALPQPELRELAGAFEPVGVSVGTTLHQRGAPATHVYFPEAALIALDFGAGDETMTIGRDGVLGISLILGEHVSPADAVVRLPGLAWRVDGPTFRQVLSRSPSLRQAVDGYVHTSMLRMARRLSCVGAHLALHRLAALLLDLQDRTSMSRLTLSHERLARLLGVRRRASVTDAMRTLETQGLVRAGRGVVEITDASGLAAVACSCLVETSGRHGLAYPLGLASQLREADHADRSFA